jgi:hypothetical protein
LRGNFVQSGLTVKLAHSNKGFRVITKPGRGFGKINTIESAGFLTLHHDPRRYRELYQVQIH